jgi:hypothetical protein
VKKYGERYEEHLAAVVACQAGQRRLPGALAERHGLLAEGLTPDGVGTWLHPSNRQGVVGARDALLTAHFLAGELLHLPARPNGANLGQWAGVRGR